MHEQVTQMGQVYQKVSKKCKHTTTVGMPGSQRHRKAPHPDCTPAWYVFLCTNICTLILCPSTMACIFQHQSKGSETQVLTCIFARTLSNKAQNEKHRWCSLLDYVLKENENRESACKKTTRNPTHSVIDCLTSNTHMRPSMRTQGPCP